MTEARSSQSLHQLVHGYRRGHELLAKSLRLPSGDLDEIARLSDLSGLQGTEESPPYLTGYPLPSGSFYALAKTWIDSLAPRGGCVLTHTVLIPMDLWMSGVPASTLGRYFAMPERSISGDLPEIDYVESRFEAEPLTPKLATEVLEFCERYFLQGTSPLIWPVTSSQCREVDHLFLRILDALWPARRRSFSGTTWALQPRRTTRGTFDVMFAPASVMGRFSNVPIESVIGRSARPAIKDARFEQVVQRMSAYLCGVSQVPWPGSKSLRAVLPESNDALLKIATLEQLASRSDENPAAAVAALDVWSALAPEPKVALEEKKDALEAAIRGCINLPELQALELLTAVAIRLRRRAFHSLRKMSSIVLSKMEGIVGMDAAGAISIAASHSNPPKELLAAVAFGLRKSNTWRPEDIKELAVGSPKVLQRILAFSPQIAASYLARFPISDASLRGGLNDVTSWVNRAPSSLRRELLRELASAPSVFLSEELLSLVIGALQSEDAAVLLSAASSYELAPSARVCQVLISFARKARVGTIQYYRSKGVSGVLDAEILGGALAGDPDSATILRQMPFKRRELRSIAVAHCAVRGGRELGREQASDLMVLLLESEKISSQLLLEALAKLVPVADPWLVKRGIAPSCVLSIEPPKVRSDFFRWMFIAAAQDALEHRENISSYAALAADKSLLPDGLRIIHGVFSSLDCAGVPPVNLWMLLRSMVPIIGTERSQLVADLVQVAFRKSRSLDTASAAVWADIVTMAEGSPNAEEVQRASLRIALENPSLPLGQVATTSFTLIYPKLPPRSQPTFFDAFFGSAADERSELVRKLVRAFRMSKWPPATLAIAGDRSGATEHIVDALSSMGWASYVEEMVGELNRSVPSNAPLARSLAEALRRRVKPAEKRGSK